MKTKGQLEAEIGEAIIKFEKEYMGRGPEETKAYVVDDMILIRLRGVLTPAELKSKRERRIMVWSHTEGLYDPDPKRKKKSSSVEKA